MARLELTAQRRLKLQLKLHGLHQHSGFTCLVLSLSMCRHTFVGVVFQLHPH